MGESSTQFGPFSVDAQWREGFGIPGGSRVIMNSNIDSLGITATGTLVGEAPPGWAVDANANVNVRFTVDRPTPYIGNYSSDSSTSFFAVVFPLINGQPAPGVSPSQGVLPPGEYRVAGSFRRFLNYDGGSFVGNYSFHFLFIPEPSTAVLLLAAGLPLLTARGSR
jgi:hypothetical protein